MPAGIKPTEPPIASFVYYNVSEVIDLKPYGIAEFARALAFAGKAGKIGAVCVENHDLAGLTVKYVYMTIFSDIDISGTKEYRRGFSFLRAPAES